MKDVDECSGDENQLPGQPALGGSAWAGKLDQRSLQPLVVCDSVIAWVWWEPMCCDTYVFILNIYTVHLGMMYFSFYCPHLTHLLNIHYCDSMCETGHTRKITFSLLNKWKQTIWWVSNLYSLPPFMSTKLRSGTTHNHNDYRHNDLIYYVLTTWYSGAYSTVMMSNNMTGKPLRSNNHYLLWTIN